MTPASRWWFREESEDVGLVEMGKIFEENAEYSQVCSYNHLASHSTSTRGNMSLNLSSRKELFEEPSLRFMSFDDNDNDDDITACQQVLFKVVDEPTPLLLSLESSHHNLSRQRIAVRYNSFTNTCPSRPFHIVVSARELQRNSVGTHINLFPCYSFHQPSENSPAKVFFFQR